MKPLPLKDDPKDVLDQRIDEVLASIAAEEPRRVNAASVRQAMGRGRAAPLPAWFAAAAFLILAVGLVVTSRGRAEKAPGTIARSGALAVNEARPTPSMVPEPAVHTNETRILPRRSPRADTPAEPPYEGLPRLVVTAIDVPEPLSMGLLSGESILIRQIEITPLVVSSLPDVHEPKQ